MLVKLKYEFIFDPSQSWQHITQFNDALASWLRECGQEPILVDSGLDPLVKSDIITVVLTKRPELSSPTQNEEKITSPKQQLARVKQMKDEKGQYVVSARPI